jgi:GAF domain-containing protein
LDKEFAEACREGRLTPDELKQLAEALAKCKECERVRIEKMVEARLVDAAELARAAAALASRPARAALPRLLQQPRSPT